MKFINIDQLKTLPQDALLMRFDKNFLSFQLISFHKYQEGVDFFYGVELPSLMDMEQELLNDIFLDSNDYQDNYNINFNVGNRIETLDEHWQPYLFAIFDETELTKLSDAIAKNLNLYNEGKL